MRPPIRTRTLGESIRAYRLLREISQMNLADTIGLTIHRYRDLKAHGYEPDLDELWAWADQLHLDPLALLLRRAARC